MKYFISLALSFSFVFIGCNEEIIELLDSKVEKYLDKYAYNLGLEEEDMERDEDEKSHKDHVEESWIVYAEKVCKIVEDFWICIVESGRSCIKGERYSKSCFIDETEKRRHCTNIDDRVRRVIYDAKSNLEDNSYDEFKIFYTEINYSTVPENLINDERCSYSNPRLLWNCIEDLTNESIDQSCDF